MKERYCPAAAGSCGRVNLSGDGFAIVSTPGLANARDQYVWEIVTARVPAAAAYATVSILGGTLVTDTCSVDRIVAVVGGLPRDVT